MPEVPLLRSTLFVPGANPRALAKVPALPCDAVILDLEDAVAPAAKPAAREAVAATLAAGGFGARTVAVRVNGADTPWHAADMAMAACSGAAAVLVPKIDDAAALVDAATALDRLGAPGGLRLWAMLETPRGVLRAEAIAGATPRLQALVMGTSDLAAALRLPAGGPGTEGLRHALGHCVLAARAGGLPILDGVHLALDDAAGFAAACRTAVALGFDGKTLIHPSTIATANAMFRPPPAAVAAARRIAAALAEAVAAGRGVTVVDGRLVEALHVADAERVLALDAAIAAREAAATTAG